MRKSAGTFVATVGRDARAALNRIRLLVVFPAVSLATTTALLVGGASLAQAAFSCPSGTTYYAGAEQYTIPNVGSSAWGDVAGNEGTVPSGHIAGYVSVSDDSMSHYLKAGLYYKASVGALVEFIAYNTDATGGVYIQEQYANPNTAYRATITKIADGVWTAQIGAHPLGYDISLSGMTKTRYYAETQNNNTSTCNGMEFTFSSIGPWPTENLHQVGVSPYCVRDTTVSDWGWISEGPIDQVYCSPGSPS